MPDVFYQWSIPRRPRGFRRDAPLMFQAMTEIDEAAVQRCRKDNGRIGAQMGFSGFYWREFRWEYVVGSVERDAYSFDRIIDGMNQEWHDRIERPDLIRDGDVVNYFLAFVHQFEYSLDAHSMGIDEYARFPLETLWDRTGDCECLSILLAALIHRAQVAPVALIHSQSRSFFARGGHVAVGVAANFGDALPGAYIEKDGRRYHFCEATSAGWAVGELGDASRNSDFWVYPID